MVIQCGCGYCDGCMRHATNRREDSLMVCQNDNHRGETTWASTFFTTRYSGRYNHVRIPAKTFHQHGLPWTEEHTLKRQWAQSPLLRINAEEGCSICSESLGDLFQDCTIACESLHIFHTKCLAIYFRTVMREERNVTCPLCRQPTAKVFTTGQWISKSNWYTESERFGNDEYSYITWLQFNFYHRIDYPKILQSREQERMADVAHEDRSDWQAQEELRRRSER